MLKNEQLIDIQQVAETFGKSVESIRKYKNFGIVRVSDKHGNKDLYDREEVLKIRSLLKELRLKGLSLSQIADELDISRANVSSHIQYTSSTTTNSSDDNNEQQFKVLLVDDEEGVRSSVKEYLETLNYSVSEAEDGEQAVAKCFTFKPNIILLDLRLPKLDGFQVCQTLKSNPVTAAIPIIMVTALNTTANKVKGIDIGADDYIEKPFDLQELAARMTMVNRRTKSVT